MIIRVYLPDGRDFEVNGTWKGLSLMGGMHLPMIRAQKAFRVPGGPFIPTGRHFAGNPLSVFKHGRTGAVLYNPRAPDVIELLRPDLRRWIDEHPEWPGELVS